MISDVTQYQLENTVWNTQELLLIAMWTFSTHTPNSRVINECVSLSPLASGFTFSLLFKYSSLVTTLLPVSLSFLGWAGKWKADAFPWYLLSSYAYSFIPYLHSLPNNTYQVFYMYQVYAEGLE